MKKNIKKHLPANTTPKVSYVKKARAYCLTSWENGIQCQVWYSDGKLLKKI